MSTKPRWWTGPDPLDAYVRSVIVRALRSEAHYVEGERRDKLLVRAEQYEREGRR